jgi:hypothetical protein
MTETAFTFNPFAAGFAQDPYPHYAELRANAPVYQHPAGLLDHLQVQGMTVAAQQALALRACLREGPEELPRRFYARAAPLIDVAWQMSTNADLSYPGVLGRPG